MCCPCNTIWWARWADWMRWPWHRVPPPPPPCLCFSIQFDLFLHSPKIAFCKICLRPHIGLGKSLRESNHIVQDSQSQLLQLQCTMMTTTNKPSYEQITFGNIEIRARCQLGDVARWMRCDDVQNPSRRTFDGAKGFCSGSAGPVGRHVPTVLVRKPKLAELFQNGTFSLPTRRMASPGERPSASR